MIEIEKKLSQLNLQRYPHIDNNLRAWSAADIYLLQSVEEQSKESPVLILNDDTGVLSLALSHRKVYTIHDSLTAKIALKENAQRNNLSLENSEFIPSTHISKLDALSPFETVLIRLPKSTTYLKDQLRSLRHLFAKGSTIFFCGMVKHISKSTKKILEGYVGPTTTHKVVKKALLFSTTVSQTVSQPLQLKQFQTEIGSFQSYSNTFSNGKIDAGTGDLLQVLPEELWGTVVDLGCGFGPISRTIAETCHGDFTLHAVDISYMAVASTGLNVPSATVSVGDGLLNFEDESIDWVISNPPFHQNTTFSVHEGLRLFKQVYAKLVKDGHFLMVANRGLNYGPYLATLFSEIETKEISKKYSLFLCTK